MISTLRFEWVRLTTIRSTWVLSVAAVALSGAVVALLSYLEPMLSRGSGPVTLDTFLATLTQVTTFTAPLIGVIGVLAFGHEYHRGTVWASLTAVPNRSALIAAKVLVVGLWSILVSALALGLAWLAATLTFGQRAAEVSIGTAPGPRILLGVVLLTLIWSLVGLAFGGLLRSSVAAIVFLLAIPWAVETAVTTLSVVLAPLAWLRYFLPFTAGQAMVAHGNEAFYRDIPPLVGGTIFAAFAIVLLAGSWVLFERRDAR